MGWIITAFILLGLAFLPLGLTVSYDSQGPGAWLRVGPARFLLYPSNSKPKVKKGKPGKKAGSTGKTASGGSIKDFFPFVRLVLDFLVDFRHKLRVDLLELKIVLAGGDPADLAQNYGKTWAALGNLWPLLERCFVIKKRNVQAQCDFESDETTIAARLDISVTVGRLLILLCRYGLRGIKEFMNFRKKRQGGTI